MAMATTDILNSDRLASWQPLDLTTLADKPRRQPNLSPNFPLAYAGSRVLVSAPPESVKSLLQYAFALDVLRAGGKVAIIDFEMGEYGALQLLRELGATEAEISRVHFYASPEGALGVDHPRRRDGRLIERPELERLVAEAYTFVLIDAGLGAYALEGINDNARDEFQAWANVWLKPLWQSGATVCLIDHEPKNGGKWAIGTERKQGEVDVHLRLEEKQKLVRGGQGSFRIYIEKDRPGFIREQAPKGWELHVRSEPDTHALTLSLKRVDDSDESVFRPTVLMERVSKFVEQQVDGCSRTKVRETVEGKSKTIGQAVEVLLEEGYIEERQVGKRSTLHHVKPYRQAVEFFGEDVADHLAGATANDRNLASSA
jgi:AAA domain